MANEKHDGGDSSNRYDLSKDPYARRPERGNPITRRGVFMGAVVLGAFGAGAMTAETTNGAGNVSLVDRKEGTPTAITKAEIESTDDFLLLPKDTEGSVEYMLPIENFPEYFTDAQRENPVSMIGGMPENELLRRRTPEQEPVPVLVAGTLNGGNEQVTTLTEITLPEKLSTCGVLIEMGGNDNVYVATRGSQSLAAELIPVKGVEARKGSRLYMLRVSSDLLGKFPPKFPPMSSVYLALNSQPGKSVVV